MVSTRPQFLNKLWSLFKTDFSSFTIDMKPITKHKLKNLVMLLISACITCLFYLSLYIYLQSDQLRLIAQDIMPLLVFIDSFWLHVTPLIIWIIWVCVTAFLTKSLFAMADALEVEDIPKYNILIFRWVISTSPGFVVFISGLLLGSIYLIPLLF